MKIQNVFFNIYTNNKQEYRNKDSQTNSFNTDYFIVPRNEITFSGFIENTEDNFKKMGEKVKQGFSSATNSIRDLFNNKEIKLSDEEFEFAKAYLKKEEDIKKEYDDKIAAIKDTFWDNFGNSSDNKRKDMREKKEDALKVARSYQDIFEERENKLIVIKNEFAVIANNLNYSKDVITALENEKNMSKKRAEINKRRMDLGNKSKFNKLAGYGEEKSILYERFIDRVDDEKAGKALTQPIANAMLFYGPTGCGKTTFAKALQEEADCNFDEIKVRGRTQSEKEKEFIEQLDKKLETAQEKFLKTNLRTIILIDEFDRFFGKDTSKSFIGYLKGKLEECSEENHVTLFLTTNDPLKIPYELRSPHRIKIMVNLDPPNAKNMLNVLRHYVAEYTSQEIDYDKVVKELMKFAPKELYSNSHIQDIIDKASSNAVQNDMEMDTDTILNAIYEYNESNSNHDLLRITKEFLDKYEDEKKELGNKK